MKKIIALLLALCLLLCGCGGEPAETTAPTTEPTTAPTTEPTEPPPVYFNPLNGEILDEPYTGRIFAHVITNTQDALPHVGVHQADFLMEMYVSRGVVRNLALFTDISDVEATGATRSTRLIFNDIAQHFDAVLVHGGGFSMVLEDAKGRGIDHINVDSLYRQGDPLMKAVAYRDKEYKRQAPNNLFAYGPGVLAYVESQGIPVTQPAEKDYYFRFADDATPVDGEIADEIHLTFGQNTKTTTMVYDKELGKYVYNQYGKVMYEQTTGEVEAFDNVLIMQAEIYENYIYQEASFELNGFGYFATGGKIIPVKWDVEDWTQPFRFMTEDGELLTMTRGNTYMAVLPYWAAPTWKEVIPPETQPVETTVETTAETVAETTAE